MVSVTEVTVSAELGAVLVEDADAVRCSGPGYVTGLSEIVDTIGADTTSNVMLNTHVDI